MGSLNKNMFIVVALLAAFFGFSGVAAAEGKIAVLNVERAILDTDEAQKRLKALRAEADYVKNKKEFDDLKKKQQDIYAQLQKDLAVMSAEQQAEQRKRITDMRADFEHVARKLQAAEQELAQTLLQEMAPKVKVIVNDLIKAEGIGLLLGSKDVLHADTSYSVTAKVTDKLNKLK